jgi:CheY-like chemotaxis protein/HPt (histidine-containing phosphotransfer) domain-containing protein
MQMNRAKGGTGLGLSISKTLVTLMHGTIGVDSEYGKGSTFYVNLPQERVSKETCGEFYKAIFDNAGDVSSLKQLSLAVLNNPEFAGLFNEKQAALPFKAPNAKILVVDDNEVNLQVADGLLQKFDIHCTKAMSGYEALDILKTQSFDIIFMDHQMPGMDGVETLEKIREAEKDLPEEEKKLVIVLSANAVNGAREMFLSKGFNDFVAKPVQGKDFADALSQWIPENLIVESDTNTMEESSGNGSRVEKSIIKTFIRLVEPSANEINDFLEKGDIKNYTIKVHALKSSARIVGNLKLSDLAAELEYLGNNADTDDAMTKIREKTPLLLDMYRKYGEALKKSIEEDEAKKAGPSDSKAISPNVFQEIKQEILDACSHNDINALDSAVEKFSGFSLSQENKALLNQLEDAAEMIDFNEVSRIAGLFKI